jgi:energy-coupling factor transporter ATP-binding protein EcfA2
MPLFPDPAPFRWRTVRVFISSTFRDFHAERDYLVKYVFPELRQWCQQWKLHLVDIDLRWGVTKEEAESGKVVDICLTEIDGSRPFFISLLGSRYGWVPGEHEIPQETYKHYTKLDGSKGLSVTHLEIMHAVLDPLTSVDLAKQIPHAYFYFRDEKSLPDPKKEPDKLKGLSKEQIEEYCKTFIEQDPARVELLKKLRAKIEDHYQKLAETNKNPEELKQRIFNYSPEFNPALPNPEDDKLMGRFTQESLKDFGERVKRDLETAIGKQFEERIKALSEKRDENKLESERDLQDSFVENRTRLFVGRTDLIKQLHDYVTAPAGKILAVHGQPGSGKSALLAHYYRIISDKEYEGLYNTANPQSAIQNPQLGLIIPDFIGASPASASLHSTLTRFCEEIKAKFNLTDEVPFDTNKLINAFAEFLKKCAAPTLIILDGLNQLDEFDNAHDLSWLPAELPENVRIIASSLDGDTWDALLRKTDRILDVSALTEIERREIIKKMPSVFCKTLDEKNTSLLLAKEQTSNPLYLKVALDELRVFGSHEKLPSRIESLSGTVIDLYVDMLNRLSSEMAEKHGKEKGELLVERLFCLLECSRYGLTDKELKELMQDHDPALDHIAIIRQLRDYFFYRDDVLDFFHRALSKAVRKRYFEENEVKTEVAA